MMNTSRLLCASLLLTACSDPTQLVVVVHSNYAVPGELAKVQAKIYGEDTTSHLIVQIFELSEVPFSFGVVPGPSATNTSRVEVLLEAFGPGDAALIRQRAVSRFQEGKTLLLPMVLYKECGTMSCDEPRETCREGACVASDVGDLDPVAPGDELGAVAVRPIAPRDASVSRDAEPNMDSGIHPDAAPVADSGIHPDAASMIRDAEGPFADAFVAQPDAMPMDAMGPRDTGVGFADATNPDAMGPPADSGQGFLDAGAPVTSCAGQMDGTSCIGSPNCALNAGCTCFTHPRGNFCAPACSNGAGCPADHICLMVAPRAPCEPRCNPAAPVCPQNLVCVGMAGNAYCRPQL